MTAADFVTLWNAGGPTLLGFGVVAAAFLYDRARPRKDENGDSISDVLNALNSFRNEMTDRLARVETDLKNHQREIDKIDRR